MGVEYMPRPENPQQAPARAASRNPVDCLEEALQTVPHALPVWQMVATAGPIPVEGGGVIIRAANHLGHAVDLFFPAKLWEWATGRDSR